MLKKKNKKKDNIVLTVDLDKINDFAAEYKMIYDKFSFNYAEKDLIALMFFRANIIQEAERFLNFKKDSKIPEIVKTLKKVIKENGVDSPYYCG